MQKISHTGLDRFFNPTVFSNASESYSMLNCAYGITMQSQLTHPADPFRKVYEANKNSDNVGAEIFPIRIVHEPDEILGFYSNESDSTISEIGELDFASNKNSSDKLLCLYLPHTWGNRPPTPPTRL
jgi:hypothetical protein